MLSFVNIHNVILLIIHDCPRVFSITIFSKEIRCARALDHISCIPQNVLYVEELDDYNHSTLAYSMFFWIMNCCCDQKRLLFEGLKINLDASKLMKGAGTYMPETTSYISQRDGCFLIAFILVWTRSNSFFSTLNLILGCPLSFLQRKVKRLLLDMELCFFIMIYQSSSLCNGCLCRKFCFVCQLWFRSFIWDILNSHAVDDLFINEACFNNMVLSTIGEIVCWFSGIEHCLMRKWREYSYKILSADKKVVNWRMFLIWYLVSISYYCPWISWNYEESC